MLASQVRHPRSCGISCYLMRKNYIEITLCTIFGRFGSDVLLYLGLDGPKNLTIHMYVKMEYKLSHYKFMEKASFQANKLA